MVAEQTTEKNYFLITKEWLLMYQSYAALSQPSEIYKAKPTAH